MQEYTVKTFEKSDFQDRNGNHWSTITFEEKNNEPTIVVHKPETNYAIGDKVYGEISDYQTKKGKTMSRFYRKQRPDGSQGYQKPQKTYGKTQEQSDQIAYLSHEKNATELVRTSEDSDIFETAKTVAAVTQILYAERELFFAEGAAKEEIAKAQEVIAKAEETKSELDSLAEQGDPLPNDDEVDVVDLSEIPF